MPAVKMPDGKVVMLSDDPAEGAKQFAELELLMSPSARQPQQPNNTEQIASNLRDAGGALGEAGKGMARGFVGMGKAIGEGLAPPSGTIAGMQIGPQPNQDMAQLKGMFDKAVAPSPENDLEKGAGFAGEVGGGMFFPGVGAATGAAKAGLGPGLNQYSMQGLTGISRRYPQAAAPEAAQAAPQLPSGLVDYIATAGGGAASHLLGGGIFGSIVAKYGLKPIIKKLLNGSGSEPEAALAPKTVPQDYRRWAQGAMAPLFSNDNND